MYKRLPLDKTLLTQFQVSIADIHTRSKQLEGSIAAKVGRDAPVRQGDVNLDSVNVVDLGAVTTAVLVHSYGDFSVSITNNNGTIQDMVCHGLFVFYGTVNNVSLRGLDTVQTRVTYICA